MEKVTGVHPVSWTPSDLGERSSRWGVHAGRIRRSFGGGWWSWCGLGASRRSEFFLRFTQAPIVGQIVIRASGPLGYSFEAVDAYSTNLDGCLVNCQWDFDYQRGHFSADPQYVLGRRELKDNEAKERRRKFEAVLTAAHTFEKPGKYMVACRIQDNLGGEAIKVEVDARG